MIIIDSETVFVLLRGNGENCDIRLLSEILDLSGPGGHPAMNHCLVLCFLLCAILNLAMCQF